MTSNPHTYIHSTVTDGCIVHSSNVLEDLKINIYKMNGLNKILSIKNNIVYAISAIVISYALLFSISMQSSFAQQRQPNITASNVFQTQTIVTGNNIKNFIVVIPNEGHEDPTYKRDLRVINQPYIPQHAVVNVGTTVVWFNADVGHRHSITLVDNNTKNIVYNSGTFDVFNASNCA